MDTTYASGSTLLQVKKGKWQWRHSMYVSTIILIHYFLFSWLHRKMWQRWWMKEELIEMARVRTIQEAICGFLLDEVINPEGEFHGDLRTSIAKEDPTMRKLIRYYSWCLTICNISSTFELRSVLYMNSICMYILYIYNIILVWCDPNISVQYGTNTVLILVCNTVLIRIAICIKTKRKEKEKRKNI